MTTAVALTTVTETTFATEVLDHEGPVLVDFWAQWCGPCHMVEPVLAEIAGERADLRIVKVNADENAAVARDHQVMSLPTLLLFHRGRPVRAIVGARPKAKLLAEIDAALADLS